LGGFGDVAIATATDLSHDAISEFLTGLAKAGVDYASLVTALLLLGSVREFLELQLDGLLRSLNHEAARTEQVLGPALKGNPSWGKTVVSRVGQRIRPHEFIVHRPERSADLPENQLLKRVLADITEAANLLQSVGESGAVAQELLAISSRALAGLRSGSLTNVTLPRNTSAIMHARARRARHVGYSSVESIALLFREIKDVDRESNWRAAFALLQNDWLEPIDDDDLFELFTLALVLKSVEQYSGFGPPIGVALLTKGRDWLAKFKQDARIVEVYFDQSPVSRFDCSSEFIAVVSAHVGIPGKAHRPDILVRAWYGDGVSRVTILECKNSTSADYISESIYKVMGYILDFESLWTAPHSHPIQAVLVVPTGIRLRRGPTATVQRLRVVSADERHEFDEIISSITSFDAGSQTTPETEQGFGMSDEGE
jgi:hypothetical protein